MTRFGNFDSEDENETKQKTDVTKNVGSFSKIKSAKQKVIGRVPPSD